MFYEMYMMVNFGVIFFLSTPYNFLLSPNVDWFQPFKRTTSSIGVIYMAVQNLPRTERFVSENVTLIGVILGPNEPKLTITSFLEPLVEELQQLWKGVFVKNATGVTCDILAVRKVCGFTGHSARLACSKCLKEFETDVFGDKLTIDFDRSQWNPRENSDHREWPFKHKMCETRVIMNVNMDANTQLRWNWNILIQSRCAWLIPCIIYC